MHAPVVDLLPSLPAGITARTGGAADAPAYLGIVQRIDLACCGESTSTLEECTDDLTAPTLDEQRGSAVVLGVDGAPIAVLNCYNELRHGRGVFADAFIDPQLAPALGDAIADALVTGAIRYTDGIAATLPGVPALVKTGLYANDRAFRGALERAGFEQHRVHWRMRIDHDGHPIQSPLLSGMEIRGHDGTEADWRTAHTVLNTAFADYYDFHPRPYEQWRTDMTSALYVLPLWRFACAGDEVVGVCLRNLRYASNGFGYISALGVLREHRGRGIATALLRDAFIGDATDGMVGTLLHGDSTNPTGAMRLYEQVGMHPDREYLAYRLRAG